MSDLAKIGAEIAQKFAGGISHENERQYERSIRRGNGKNLGAQRLIATRRSSRKLLQLS
jgi:hypothetical protein